MSDSPNILVTGGAGFIGAQTCKALKEAGFTPVCYDNFATGHRDAVRFGPLVEGDVRDRQGLEAALRKYRVSAVIHFAASAYVGESMQNPGLYYDNNLGGMIGLLAACAAARVGQIVFSSSCATYGVPQRLPISETTAQLPINPYGRTKLICEQMLADHSAAHGLRYVALRYFNAAGADPEGELGERHSPETHLLPLAMAAALGQGPALRVFGSDYPTEDGTCIRDYVHVADLAEAHVRALGYLRQGGDAVALNLGTGKGLSIRQILAGIEALTGRPVPVEWHARRPGDPPALIADPARARALLGFEAQRSSLSQILWDALPWFGGRRAA